MGIAVDVGVRVTGSAGVGTTVDVGVAAGSVEVAPAGGVSITASVAFAAETDPDDRVCGERIRTRRMSRIGASRTARACRRGLQRGRAQG
jgi:hypothetical protein